MFGADVVMTEPAGFIDGVFEHLLRFGGQFDLVVSGAAFARQALDHLAHAFGVQAQVAQDAPGNAAFLFHQTKQQMLGADGFLCARSASWCARLSTRRARWVNRSIPAIKFSPNQTTTV